MSKFKKKIREIQKELNSLGLMLPGGIGTQWYSCQKKGCKCMDSENPKKHGPYHQLSYRIAGKSSTMIIKDKDLKLAQKFIENHQRFKELSKELLKAHVDLIRNEGFNKSKKIG
jgi:Na+/phosphate symporter